MEGEEGIIDVQEYTGEQEGVVSRQATTGTLEQDRPGRPSEMEIFVVDSAGLYKHQADMAVLQSEKKTEVQQTSNPDGDDIQPIKSSRVILSGKLKPACAVAEKGSFPLIYPYGDQDTPCWQSICKQGQ